MIIKKPVIGITPSHNTENDDISLRPTYLRAILAAGGVPVVLPLEAGDDDLKMFAHMFDGFLFSGGPDPHPFLFGEETQANCGNASIPRDTMELALLKAVMNVRKPILGICRGAQIINGISTRIHPARQTKVSPLPTGSLSHIRSLPITCISLRIPCCPGYAAAGWKSRSTASTIRPCGNRPPALLPAAWRRTPS